LARSLRIYFASDLHGSERCFRKFLNAGPAYKADVLILGGDVAGKAIQPILRTGSGAYTAGFRGVEHRAQEGPELDALERMIADHGYYAYRAEPGEMEERQTAGSLDELFLDLMRDRLAHWTELADDRLRPRGIPIYWMLGNDDPPALEEVLRAAPYGEYAEGQILSIDGHELLSYGWANTTPFKSYREVPEEELERRLCDLGAQLREPERAVFNLHVPPYDSGLDQAPLLDEELRVQQVLGQVKFVPVGSQAVRHVVERFGPLASLHGHVHESAGFRRIGRTLSVNPGSDYNTGALNGVLLTLEKDKVKAHQLVRG
jgi:uncharacterized protein